MPGDFAALALTPYDNTGSEPHPVAEEKAGVFTISDPGRLALIERSAGVSFNAVLENLRFGLPVIQYIDGKTVETPAEQLAPKARQILAANGEYLPGEEKPSWW